MTTPDSTAVRFTISCDAKYLPKRVAHYAYCVLLKRFVLYRNFRAVFIFDIKCEVDLLNNFFLPLAFSDR